jgi:nucleoside-diphosphate-sugar epimerase
MPHPIKDLKWREALPRMAADLVIVHLSMIAALAVSVVYRSADGNPVGARELTSDFAHYYTVFFWLLSPVFPAVFLLNGFYTHTRRHKGSRKTWLILRGVVLAVMIFFGANVFFFGQSTVGRSVALPFMILASLGLACSRLTKAYFEHYFEVRRKNGLFVPGERGQVLVIGGAGYIGSLLVESLLGKGYRVRVLDSLLYGEESLRPVKDHPNFELMVGDCRNIQDMVRAVRGVESVVHLAAIVGDPACEQNQELALETNYAATRMLIEIAKGHGVRRLLFASSCSVYGATDVEVDENAAARPISFYGQTKVNSEQAVLDSRGEDFHPTILRFATVFGLSYRPRFDLVVNLLTAKAKQEGVITIYNGQQWRPFIHVRDLAEATVRVLETPAALVSGEIFNVGDKRLNHTLTQVAEIIREVFPSVRVEHIENSDRRNYRVNFKKLFNRTGFEARYTLYDGVRELAQAFDGRLIADYKDLRYHNQHYLKVAGAPEHKDEFDKSVMAAHADTFRLLNAELRLQRFREKLAAALTPQECWEVLQQNYSDFGFQEIRFKMGDHVYWHASHGNGFPNSWTVRIHLAGRAYLNLSRESGAQVPPIVARVSDMIGEILSAKIPTKFSPAQRSKVLREPVVSRRRDAPAQPYV